MMGYLVDSVFLCSDKLRLFSAMQSILTEPHRYCHRCRSTHLLEHGGWMSVVLLSLMVVISSLIYDLHLMVTGLLTVVLSFHGTGLGRPAPFWVPVHTMVIQWS